MKDFVIDQMLSHSKFHCKEAPLPLLQQILKQAISNRIKHKMHKYLKIEQIYKMYA